MTAPVEVDLSGTDDETFSFNLDFVNSDDTAFPFNLYAIEYRLTRKDCRSTVLTLTQGAGITVSAPTVSFRKPDGSGLDRGEYEHGCRVKLLSTGDYTQVFDGSVTITEGHF